MRKFTNSEMAEAVVSHLPDQWKVLGSKGGYGRISHFIS
jgi:hypothetical protein